MKKKIKTHLIGVEEIQEIVKLVVGSGFLRNHKPLSLLLIGDVGIGKTEIISTFNAKNTAFLTDLSSTGVYNIVKKNKNITHIIIADFTKITMKQRATTNNLLTTLNSAMEEGLYKQELKGVSENLKGRNIGVITSTTRASFSQNKKKMEEFGLNSRFVMVSFSYSSEKFWDIMESIYKSEYLMMQYKSIPLQNGIKKTEVKITPEFSKQLNHLRNNSFRTQKQLQTLACSSALLNNRIVVTQEDIDKILKLTKYMNTNYNPV